MMNHTIFRKFFYLLTLIAVLGCGKRPSDLPKLIPCELTVQFEDGTPIDEALVVMYPAQGKWFANGITNVQGMTKMSTSGSFSGAAPGEYRITVEKREIVYPPGFDPNSEDENQPEPMEINYIDTNYASAQETPLKIEVSQDPIRKTLQVKKTK